MLPTPLEAMPNLTKALGYGELFIKRDDLTGLAFGGNKARKLDYIVKYALDNGYTTLLTYGGVQTNHGRMTIAAAAKFGLKSILMCYGQKPERASGNLVLDRMMGAEVVFMDTTKVRQLPKSEMTEGYINLRKHCTAEVIKKYEANGDKVLIVPMGGHNEIGTVGYIEAIPEIMNQMKNQNIKSKYLVVGYGSTGTFAGLWLGAKYYHAPFEVIGVPMSPQPNALKDTAEFINKVSATYEMNITCDSADLNVATGPKEALYAGVGYNVPDAITREYMYLLARTEGILTDPCYTGKIFHGFCDLITKGIIPHGESAIFLHTGGTPAIWTEEHLNEMQDEIWAEEGITILE